MEIKSENDETEAMDFDGLQDKLGGITPYQITTIILACVLPLGTGFIGQIAVFYSAVPEHRCALPPFENNPPTYEDANITQILIPEDSSCQRYDYNLTTCGADVNNCTSENVTTLIDCDNGFVYSDQYYKETTVSQFNLVCGKSTLDAVANSLFFVGVFIGSAIIGPLMDWSGRKVSMLITCIAMIVTSLLVAFSFTYEMYISMRVLQAMCAIPCFIACFTYANEITTKRWKTLVGAYVNIISSVSHTILPFLAYVFRYWRNLGICVTVFCTPYLVIYFFIPKSPRWLLTKRKDDDAKKIVVKYAKSKKQELRDEDWNLVVETENKKLNDVSAEEMRYTLLDLFKPSLMRMVSLNICYLWFVVSMVFYGLTLNVGTLVGDPYVNSVLNGFVEILGSLIFIVSTRLIGIRITGALSYFLSGVCCLTTMLLIQFADGNKAMEEASRWIAILGKLFATLSFTLIYQYTTELYPTVARGTAMSMGSMSARIGSIIMPFTLELQKSIPWLTQTIFGSLGIIGGAICLLLPETLNARLMSTIDDAENFYRKNMKVTASIMAKANEIYQSELKSRDTVIEHEFDNHKEKVKCALPPFENDPPSYEADNITQLLIPMVVQEDNSCQRYDYNLTTCEIDLDSCTSGNVTTLIDCDNGFVYSDQYYKETTVSQFDLVCGRSTLDALANSLGFVGVFIGSAIIGPLMDWFGRKVSMLIACIAMIVTSLLVAFSSTYEMYISMRVLQTVSGIPCFIACFTYVNELATKRWKTLVGTYVNIIPSLSHTILPLLAYFLRYWRNLGICATVLCTPYLVIYFFIPKSPRWLLTKRKDDDAKKIVQKYAKSKKQELRDEDWNLVVETENKKLDDVSKGEIRYTVLDLFKPSVMRMVSLNICYLWFVVSMVFYGLTLNVGTLVGDPYVNSLLNGFVEIVGNLLFLVSTRVIGIRITGSLSYSLSGVCCLTTMLLSQFADGNKAMEEASRWIAILGKLFSTMSFTLIYQYTTELYPTVARGTAMSMGSMSARIGSIIIPFTLELQKSIPWLTQTIFGTLGIIGGATCLLLPETLNAGLMSTISDAENFYRKNMTFTASIMGKTNEIYQSELKSRDTVTEYEFDYDNDEVKQAGTRF